jgi:hypothetical protein
MNNIEELLNYEKKVLNGIKRNIDKTNKNYEKAKLLLYRVYKLIEMDHLNDYEHVLSPGYDESDKYYSNKIKFSRNLGEDIFNFLQNIDETFQKVVIKRQKRYRNRQRKLDAGRFYCPYIPVRAKKAF